MDRVLTFSVLVAVMLLSACQDKTPEATRQLQTVSQQLVPANAELAALYQRSCRSCHTIAATGAPLTGDVVAWTPRMERGMPAMIDSVIYGAGGMPPLGMCMDCSEEQFEALIGFMSGGQ